MKTEFSNRMKEVFNYVREEVIRLGDKSIGVEHLFLGILREGEGTAVRVLKGLGIDPKDLNITNKNKENLKGKNAEFNAKRIIDIFKGEDNEFSDSVALNTAAGLVVSGKEKNFKNAYEFSNQYLKSGKVYKHLLKIQGI